MLGESILEASVQWTRGSRLDAVKSMRWSRCREVDAVESMRWSRCSEVEEEMQLPEAFPLLVLLLLLRVCNRQPLHHLILQGPHTIT